MLSEGHGAGVWWQFPRLLFPTSIYLWLRLPLTEYIQIFCISNPRLEIFICSYRHCFWERVSSTWHASCTKQATSYRYGEIKPAALIPEEKAKQVFGQHVLLELLYSSSVHSPAEKGGLLQPLHCTEGKILLGWWQVGSPALEIMFLSGT